MIKISFFHTSVCGYEILIMLAPRLNKFYSSSFDSSMLTSARAKQAANSSTKCMGSNRILT